MFLSVRKVGWACAVMREVLKDGTIAARLEWLRSCGNDVFSAPACVDVSDLLRLEVAPKSQAMATEIETKLKSKANLADLYIGTILGTAASYCYRLRSRQTTLIDCSVLSSDESLGKPIAKLC